MAASTKPNPKIWNSYEEFAHYGVLFLDLEAQFGQIKMRDMMSIAPETTEKQWGSLAALYSCNNKMLMSLKDPKLL